MEIVIIPVGSLTHALKGQKVLERNGFSAWAGRDHGRLTGCGYQISVRVGPNGSHTKDRALALLRQAGVRLLERS